MKTLRLILGDQLSLIHSWFNTTDPEVLYVMMEIRPETDYVKHHIQKLLGVLGAMRQFADQLRTVGHNLVYLKLTEVDNLQLFGKNINAIILKNNIECFEYQEPDEYRVDQLLKSFCNELNITWKMVPSEHFLTSRYELKDFFGKKNYLMESFYREMRRRFNVLMENGQPIGGQWNFDANNRNRYDGRIPIPKPLKFDNDLTEVFRDMKISGVDSFGNADPSHFTYPINRKQALELVDYFDKNLLPHFGTYQDAMVKNSTSLFHARISFALNTKMISPLEVIRSAVETWQSRPDEIGLEQVEGYVRQILGWREYVRGVYWAKMPDYAKMNYFDHKNKLPEFYWTGDTRMNCLKHAIRQSLDKAYAHHIQRLMITGNFALLAQVHPDEVDAWYLGIYIDAFEWVELTNTRGMSQYADGGIMASKPYVSSANYINNMSDYCRSCFYDAKKRIGANACPFNSLYWNFFDRHQDKLRKNPRIGMAYRNLDKMNPEEKAALLEQAEKYLDTMNEL
ncbi:MAG: cryptochrome/photolyase family protein [Bacteroidales bacterium]|nr:cryptochrome/photolyase family protein [Bacteroidales bacterium]